MSRRRDRALLLIAVFRLTKAVALFAAGLGALRLIRPAAVQRVVQWLAPLAADHAVAHRVLVYVAGVSPHRAEIIAAVAFAYGAVMSLEGVGLWMQKRWAEWLTIIVTASFIPWEVVELVRRVTAMRIALLVANLAIVAYLVVRRVRHR